MNKAAAPDEANTLCDAMQQAVIEWAATYAQYVLTYLIFLDLVDNEECA